MDPELLRYLKGLFVGVVTVLAILSPLVIIAIALVVADLKGKRTPDSALPDRPSRLQRIGSFLVWTSSILASSVAFFKEKAIPYFREHVLPQVPAEPVLKELPEPPAFRIALRHRCFKSRNRRIFVTDHSDGKSVASLIIGSTKRQRIPLGELETSPDSDRQFVEQCEQLRQTPQNPPVSTALRPDLVNFIRVNDMPPSNRWIWKAGAFDHLTDKPLLLLGLTDQRIAA